mmetsp:Transcript_10129/g.11562  ORF Transcript_10129/g.11562 Transcript_10129/m.11562 type:complete len:1311 (-) Transcript_10129:91-4023(-)
MSDTSSSYSSYSDTVVETWHPQSQSQRCRRTSLPGLLRLRSTHGMLQRRRQGYGSVSNMSNNFHLNDASMTYLSYRGAWNPTRLQNSILVVGPGTPASTVQSSQHTTSDKMNNQGRYNEEEGSESLSSSSSSASNESNNEEQSEDEEKENANNEEENSEDCYMMDDKEDDDDDDDDVEELDNDDSTSEGFYEYMRNNYGDSDDNDLSSQEESAFNSGTSSYRPNMRHGGCINTATWLSDCGWRLSTASTENGDSNIASCAVASKELPTQVVTSGDDRLLKVFDLSEAMGNSSPFKGISTRTPFSSSSSTANDDHCGYKERWQSFVDARRRKSADEYGCGDDYRPPGTVRLLASVSTGHKGNVFHVTPLKGRPGMFATCGADGYLRLVNVERCCSNYEGENGSNSSGSSTVVVHPMYDHNNDDARNNSRVSDPGIPLAFFLRNNSGMCFSHTMTDDLNIGLLCSEKGLIRFDLRLSPREQCTKSLLPRTTRSSGSMVRSMRSCKACAVLPVNTDGGAGHVNGGGSTYVFAGGSSPAVALCDLRMTGSRVLQYYNPVSLSEENNVSVSGLDLSRDGKELLVSYESDQIYTFPVFPHSESPCRSATDQLMELLDKDAKSNDNDDDESLYPWGKGKHILPELRVRYGAHLNRFTFLKNATYAGPNDEYICTGSDSGHAWVYEKATGAVVSFWKADQSTCNGVVPHPTLPFFVTYGIDSTAKLWRSTTPVDSDVDDSAIGRRTHFRKKQNQSFEMSPTVSNWEGVQSILENLDLREAGSLEESEIFPDQIPCNKVLMRSGRLRRLDLPKIGNDLHNLPDVLKGNLFIVLRSLYDDDDVPVESDINDFKRRVSLIRLRHQADSLGLTWNPIIPWMMEGKSTTGITRDAQEDHLIDPSELVPDYPSDWIPYDPEMSNDPFDFREYFCYSKSDVYADFYRDRYRALYGSGFFLIDDDDSDNICEYNGNVEIKNKNQITAEDDRVNESEVEEQQNNGLETDDGLEEYDNSNAEQQIDSEEKSLHRNNFTRHARILAETVKTLKDGGNIAFKAGNLGLAAHRYDKAIQYGSVVYMNNRKIGTCRFDYLLKNLIMTRLNMALVLLTSYFMELGSAAKQARLALEEVSPYCDSNKDDNKDKESLDEALALKAKAYFRLGSAQYEMGDYSDAIYSLEESIKSTKKISDLRDNIPDSLVLRRLAHAKREHLKHTKRRRKKFKFAFESLSAGTPPPSTQANSNPSRPNLSVPLSLPLPLPLPSSVEPAERIEITDATASTTTTTAPNSTTEVTIANVVTPMNSPAATGTVVTEGASLDAGSTKDA